MRDALCGAVRCRQVRRLFATSGPLYATKQATMVHEDRGANVAKGARGVRLRASGCRSVDGGGGRSGGRESGTGVRCCRVKWQNGRELGRSGRPPEGARSGPSRGPETLNARALTTFLDPRAALDRQAHASTASTAACDPDVTSSASITMPASSDRSVVILLLPPSALSSLISLMAVIAHILDVVDCPAWTVADTAGAPVVTALAITVAPQPLPRRSRTTPAVKGQTPADQP